MRNNFISKIFLIMSLSLGMTTGFFSVKFFLTKDEVINISVLDSKDTEIPKEEVSIQEVIIEEQKEEKPVEIVKKEEIESKKKKNDCPEPKKEYEDQTYKNVGQDIGLSDKSYIPSDLVELPKEISKYENLCVKEEARDALILMIDEAKKEKLFIKVSSGFRDYSTQKSILETNIKSGNKNATKLVAKPGYSEHQLGVAVDLTSPSIENISATSKFGKTKESAWLKENAYKYGFIESYPEGKEDITGYLYEPWHYRYVGIDNALLIHESGKTINEFFAKEEPQNKTTE